jgi:transglutaminase-like putative cysteine protease
MLLAISHKTELTYAEPISESVMELRMMPRTDATQTLRNFGLAVGPEAPVFEHLDWQGNRAHHFSIVDVHDKVVIMASSVVDTHARQLKLESLPDVLPLPGVGHRYQDFLMFHGPAQRDARLTRFAEERGLLNERRVAVLLAAVTNELRDLIGYKKGVTTSATTVSDVLDLGHGVCQDYAHVGLSLLRMMGIPARYVSGYLFRQDSEELETHAWLEAFLPSAGWIGLDPTHGELSSDSHIAVAVGRSYADVPPNRGVYRGGAEESIEVRVRIERLGDTAEPTAIPLARPDARVLSSQMVRERALDLASLEQQQQQQQQ